MKNMKPLDKTLRNRLERTVKDARYIAEDAARAALEQLGVGDAAPFSYLSEQDRDLRRRLRVHGRQLGDHRHAKTKIQEIDRLLEKVAYEHWHRMLFARFLAENDLLMYPDPEDPVAVTLEECEDLAADEGAATQGEGWHEARALVASPHAVSARSGRRPEDIGGRSALDCETMRGVPDAGGKGRVRNPLRSHWVHWKLCGERRTLVISIVYITMI